MCPTTIPPALPEAARVTDPAVKATYAVDSAIAAVGPHTFEVIRARDLGDVLATVEYAQATGTPIVPQGARTGLCGGSVASEGAIVLNVEKLNDIIDVDPVEGLARVGPGVINADLKAAALSVGLFYPPDPASSQSCTIGGNVATNAGGLCCIKYGVTADYVRGLQVALPTGELLRTGRATAKGVAGVDLTGCFVGSEGTFGVLTEVIVKLVPAPEPALTALATFDDLGHACAAIVALRRDPHRPSLLEFLDAASIAGITALADVGFPSGCAAALLVQSDRSSHTSDDVQRYAEIMTGAGATDVAVADDPSEGEALMAGRRMLNAALEHMGHHLKEDMCVPVSKLADLVSGGLAIGQHHGVRITMSGHGGDGNLHPALFYDPADHDSLARARRAFDDMMALTLTLGGTIAGEHGIGVLKRDWLPRELSPTAMRFQHQLKALFDPRGIMNPGKVL